MLLDIPQTYGWLILAATALSIIHAIVCVRRQREAERRARAEWNLRTRDDRA